MKKCAALMVLLALSGCESENRLTRKDDPHTGSDTGPVHLDTADTAVMDEVCNGEDDDGDGVVDEGFEDLDGDGFADCVDDDCDVNQPGATTIEINEECGASMGATDPWNVDVEWQWVALSAGPSINRSIVPPLVDN